MKWGITQDIFNQGGVALCDLNLKRSEKKWTLECLSINVQYTRILKTSKDSPHQEQHLYPMLSLSNSNTF